MPHCRGNSLYLFMITSALFQTCHIPTRRGFPLTGVHIWAIQGVLLINPSLSDADDFFHEAKAPDVLLSLLCTLTVSLFSSYTSSS